MKLAPLNHTTGHTRILGELRTQMTDLQLALGTGRKSETYGGLGADRFTSLSLHERKSGIEAFKSTIDLVALRLSLADQALGRLSEIASEVGGDARSGAYSLQGDGRTLEQRTAYLRLDEAVAMLNTKADGRYIFGGTRIDRPPVAATSAIIDGEGTKDGLRTLIAERKAADAGASGLGRLATSTTATAVTLAEDGTHPFGFKLTAITTTTATATTTGPTGAPPSVSIDFGVTQPAAGDEVRVVLALPDGTETTVSLTAVAGTPGENEFEIGGTVAATVTNLETALGLSLTVAASTELAAASAVTAADSFFAGTPTSPPLRVDGPPFDSATALVAGTATNTVIWYSGETSVGNPRRAASATVDEGLQINYGMEASEQAFRHLMQYSAVYAVETFDATVATDAERFEALRGRVGAELDFPVGTQSVTQVRVEIGVSQSLIAQAGERHQAELGVINNLQGDIETVDTTEAAAQLLTLQTRLQASYEVTSLISQMTLINFLR